MIPFALQPDLQFKFLLAEHLHMTVAQIREMDVVEFAQWQIHLARQARLRKEHADKMHKTRSRPRRR